MPCWTPQPWPHNLISTVSGKPGAVHIEANRDSVAACWEAARTSGGSALHHHRESDGMIGVFTRQTSVEIT